MSQPGLDAGYPLPQELGLSSTYIQAIRYTNLSPNWLHRPFGRAVVVGTDIFYSPNSSLAPAPPPPASQPLLCDATKDNVAEFHQPRWWSPSAAYLPFLPTFPNFYSPPFHVLFHDSAVRKRSRVQMNSGDALEWADLEQRLKLAIQQFQSAYGVPSSQIVPITPTALAWQGPHDYPSQFAAAEKRSRNWFSLWMAIISFCIAIAQVTDGEDDSVACPSWFRCLVRYVDERTASGLRQQLSQFSGSYLRAGVFLNLLENSPVQKPTVDFYVKFGIPVWYQWGDREEAHARANPVGFSRFVPPPHLLQAAKLFLTKEPTPVDNDRPWEVFFQERKRRATKAGPMPRKKPTLKVFLWEKDSEGKWARTLVHSREKQETLHEHGRHQKVFDERTNEWDCCMAMGILDPDEKQAADWSDDDDDPILPIGRRPDPNASIPVEDSAQSLDTLSEPLPAPTPPSTSSQSEQQPSFSESHLQAMPTSHTMEKSSGLASSSSSSQIHGGDHWSTDAGSPADVLRLFYGFVPPPLRGNQFRLPTYKDDGNDAQNLAQGIGELSISPSYIQSPLGQAAVNFFWSISQKEFVPPRNEMYDLLFNNISSIKKSSRLSFMHRLPGNIFIFNFKDLATVPWSIGLTNVVDAMFVLRLDSQFNDYQVAYELLNRGIRFLTLLRVPSFAIAPIPISIPRIRLSGYSFTKGDYTAYCQEREEMLRNPRIARGALKQGGILWRLAMGTASFHDVLSGPSGAVMLRRQCMCLNPGDRLMWVDDSLDSSEMDILCGVYYVFTGQSSQQAIKSWWPPVQVWDNNMRLGFWNGEYEDIYDTRLQELESGTAVPLSSEQWRKKIRPFAVVRRAFDHTTKSANSLLQSLPH